MSRQAASEHGSGQVLRDRVAEVIEGRDYLLVPQVYPIAGGPRCAAVGPAPRLAAKLPL